MKDATRRLFFALWPTAGQRALMAEAASPHLDACGGRVVAESNLHVTLAFLGSVPERRLEEVADIGRRIAASGVAVPPLQIAFERLEYWKKAQVLCALPGGRSADADGRRWTTDVELRGASALAAALKNDLVAAGFAPDLKPFQAHVTLARKVASVPSPVALPPVCWSFEDYALVESHADARGSQYRAVHTFSL